MSMIFAEQSHQGGHFDGLRSIALSVAVSVLALIAIPVAALAVSYVAGGMATSTLLFVYVFAVLTNVPFLLGSLAVMTSAVALSRLVARAR
jgi:hypothetical protein